MINNRQFRDHIVRPTLDILVMWSQQAEDLLVMTMAYESNGGEFLKQKGGPALGIYQMEPATFDELYNKKVKKNLSLSESICLACGMSEYSLGDHDEMIGNLSFATAMARINYARFSEKIPLTPLNMSEYAKKYWNTNTGKATPQKYLEAYNRFNL